MSIFSIFKNAKVAIAAVGVSAVGVVAAHEHFQDKVVDPTAGLKEGTTWNAPSIEGGKNEFSCEVRKGGGLNAVFTPPKSYLGESYETKASFEVHDGRSYFDGIETIVQPYDNGITKTTVIVTQDSGKTVHKRVQMDAQGLSVKSLDIQYREGDEKIVEKLSNQKFTSDMKDMVAERRFFVDRLQNMYTACAKTAPKVPTAPVASRAPTPFKIG